MTKNQRNVNPFRSFWMGGYECSDQLNSSGCRVDLLLETGHLQRLKADYEQLVSFGIHTVREGIRWSHVERSPGVFDFREVGQMMLCARELGIQQVWDLCHFGFPDDLTPLHPRFAERFAGLCRAFASFCRSGNHMEPLIVTPINEVSFISWLGGETAGTSPYCTNYGWQVKYALMRAYIKGIEALLKVDPEIRILTTEPLVNIVPPLNADGLQKEQACSEHDLQFQSLDILSGRICPELGGKPEYLDILGFNYYYNNQWVLGLQDFLPWANDFDDERWRPLSSLIDEAYSRYGRPMIISETSHPGIDRPIWIEFISRECTKVLRQDLPLWGICLYPIIDRPDWNDLSLWHHSGLWDAPEHGGKRGQRVLYEPYAKALRESMLLLNNAGSLKDRSGVFQT